MIRTVSNGRNHTVTSRLRGGSAPFLSHCFGRSGAILTSTLQTKRSKKSCAPTAIFTPRKREAISRKMDDVAILNAVRNAAKVPQPGASLERCIVDTIPSSARFVLIGEASHGTDEFYRIRAEVTKMLIEERGFNAVACEADFPDAFRANMFVRGLNDDRSADEALGDFIRFPTWMWRNEVVKDFLNWLREHNDKWTSVGDEARKVGFYGVDVYSLHTSMKEVVSFLEKVDPQAAKRIADRYACFDRFGEDPQQYALAAGMGMASCAEQAIQSLHDMLAKRANYAAKCDGEVGEELAFAAACNAAVVAGAEAYYANMLLREESTWNLRDRHFLDTVTQIERHLNRRLERYAENGARKSKIVVWAHNSHLGDARYTEMGKRRDELNLGQLMRQAYGLEECFNIGFTTHTGTVAAADRWDAPGQKKVVRKSMPGSYENLLHRAEMPEFVLDMRGNEKLGQALDGPLLERAIGVIYAPRTERQSHYFYATLPKQFDCVVHIDQTQAIMPLEPAHPSWEKEHLAKEDIPDTYPFGV